MLLGLICFLRIALLPPDMKTIVDYINLYLLNDDSRVKEYKTYLYPPQKFMLSIF